MTFLDSIRMRIFKGYDPQKPVTVEWWSGRQHADIHRVLDSTEARDLIQAQASDSSTTARGASSGQPSAARAVVTSSGGR